MKITVIDTTQMISSKLVKSLSARRRHLLHVMLGPSEEPTATDTEGPDDWQDDGAVGIRGWYY